MWISAMKTGLKSGSLVDWSGVTLSQERPLDLFFGRLKNLWETTKFGQADHSKNKRLTALAHVRMDTV